jgi:single-stranded-DNA-specific exonuclease
MFLPSKLKYAAILKKTLDSLKRDKKVIIISSSHLIMNHTYNILSSYISPSNIYYNKKSRLKSNIINKEKIIMLTVPAFFHNAKLFNSDNFEIIIDEPYYSISHNSIKNVNEYKEFQKYIVYKKKNISIFGTLFHSSLKEFFKRAGFKTLVSNVNVSNYEIIKEKKNLMLVLKEYLKESKHKVIVLNEKKKQDILSKILKEKFGFVIDGINFFNHSMEFSSKLMTRENIKKHSSNILITSYSNNGLPLENKNKNPIFILLDLPKSRLELIDLFSSWSPKKGVLDIVLGYDEKFKARLLYDYSRLYPSSNILKQTYDYIKNNDIKKESELIDKFFKGDQEFAKIVIDELFDSGLLINNSNELEIIENFNLQSLHKTVRNKESIIDNWLIKETIHFYENVDTKAFMDMLKNDITNAKNKEV